MADRYILNDGHLLEAIDRIHVATCYLQDNLAEHALIDSAPVFANSVQDAITILAELYQTIGALDDIKDMASKYYVDQTKYEVK